MNQSNTMLPASVMAAFMIFADAKIYLSYIYREIMRNRYVPSGHFSMNQKLSYIVMFWVTKNKGLTLGPNLILKNYDPACLPM